MRKVKRWRFFCDHCKKSGGTSHHMLKHERGCTANPDRVCGICDRIGINAAPLAELIAFVRQAGKSEYDEHSDHYWLSVDAEAFAQLKQKADECPCCILAALRQTKAEVKGGALLFDFKKELKEIWSRYDDDAYQDRVASYHAY